MSELGMDAQYPNTTLDIFPILEHNDWVCTSLIQVRSMYRPGYRWGTFPETLQLLQEFFFSMKIFRREYIDNSPFFLSHKEIEIDLPAYILT